MLERLILKTIEDIRYKSALESKGQSSRNPKLPFFIELNRKSAIILLYLFNYDPLAIYKKAEREVRKPKYKFYQRPELQMQSNDQNILLLIMRKLRFCSFLVAITRFTIICFVQMVKQMEDSYSGSQLPSKKGVVNKIVPGASLLGILKKLHLDVIFGNFLSDFPGLSLATYLTLSAGLTHMIYYMPYRFASEPMDASNIRIGLNLAQEQKRIDLKLRETIETLVLSSTRHRHCLHHAHLAEAHSTAGFYERFSRQYYLSKMISPSPELASRGQPSVPIEEPERLVHSVIDASMRPVRFSTGYYQVGWRTSTIVTLIVVPMVLFFAIAVQVFMIIMTKDMKCELKQIQPCSFLIAYTWSDLYSIFESFATMYWFGFVLCLLIILMMVTLSAQLISMVEMKSDLISLLGHVRSVNMIHYDQDKFRKQSYGRSKALHLRESSADLYLNEMMLKKLVRTRVILDEISNQADFLSQMISAILTFFGTALVALITTAPMDRFDMRMLRAIIMTSVWLGSNSMLILSAYQYAKISSLQTIGWSIVAQLNKRLVRNYHINRQDRLCPDPLTIGWQQLVKKGYLAHVQNSVRPFGVSITYQLILQLNYYIISLAVLVSR